jgi:predicted RNA-binding Zn ribbon-like protein
VSGNGKPRFELSGGALCLDFANTWEDRGRPDSERIHEYGDFLAFAEQSGLLARRQTRKLEARAREAPSAAREALAAAIDLRESLYRLFSALAAGLAIDRSAVERVNAVLADTASGAHVALELDGREFAWTWRGLDRAFAAPLAPIARSAAELVIGSELDRIRECDSERCTWLFLDASRNRSRRWCSMETCGNRAKARRHYQRVRAAPESAPRKDG